MSLHVLDAGPLATIQDLGRPGQARWGVPRSGALDRGALRLANRLVGNDDEGAAGIEVTLGGFRALAARDLWVAVTGAWAPLRIDGRWRDPFRAQRWPEGTELRLDRFDRGARAYLAVRGGIVSEPVAGSRATDVLSGLGPAPLRPGRVVPVGEEPLREVPPLDIGPWSGPPIDEMEIEVTIGPRADWFSRVALDRLFGRVWTVAADSDRVGARLDGPELPRVRHGELPSEGMLPGALQVPPSGRPTVLLADGPVTGGYPVIAVATDAGVDAVAQARPGVRLRFRHARAAP